MKTNKDYLIFLNLLYKRLKKKKALRIYINHS